MSNLEFLQNDPEYALFSTSAIEAEKVYATSPAMCAIGCRKALELAVKWCYAADSTMEMPYRDNLQSLIHEPTFRFSLDEGVWDKLPYIIKLGNMAVHTGKNISASDALLSLKNLFEFIEWIDYCYGKNYVQRRFDENAIPKAPVEIDEKKAKERESLLDTKDSIIADLQKKIEALSASYTAGKEKHKKSRSFNPETISEYQTRKQYIDLDLKEAGWIFDGPGQNVFEEYPVKNMAGVVGQKGYVDYVLMGQDGKPLAVVEAKKTSKDPFVGQQQAQHYAEALRHMTGCRPMIFLTNGFETHFWDDLTGPKRRVSGIFGQQDLQKLMLRRKGKKPLETVPVNDDISGRYYQKEAIRAVCEHVEQGFRKNLVVMATGTGKTRTAAGLVDVLSRGGYVTNVLFLADRTALVEQAKEAFQNNLKDMSLCNLCSSKDDRNARIVFSTYPTILNAIDSTKTDQKVFTPAHFDLIICDECHRSIFRKYATIFDYFDAILVGLTATPKDEVDRNTYDFFEVEQNVPTYAYGYETAVNEDHVLVPYYTYATTTKFIREGIKYDDLTPEEKEKYEEAFEDAGVDVPDFVPSAKLNKFLFNEPTVDQVLQDLMERGIKIDGGDMIGKTIIFAQNKNHAQYIVDRFNKLYPQISKGEMKGSFIQRVVCDDAYVQETIKRFKNPDSEPQIAVSVDMMDTGVDVPNIVNLVFFKQVKSKIKFWQMIGRGTRLCPDLICTDQIDGEYIGKKRFLIFDYCDNFKFFGEKPNGFDGKDVQSLEERIFCKQVDLMYHLQDSIYASDVYQAWRTELTVFCNHQVKALEPQLASVKLRLRYVERYKNEDAYLVIDNTKMGELKKYIAPLVKNPEHDPYAKRFDNFMYGLVLSGMENAPGYGHAVQQLCNICALLQKLISIPQVNKQLALIQKVQKDQFWEREDLYLQLENVRKNLRNLIQFLGGGDKQKPVYTKLKDPIIEEQSGVTTGDGYDFQDYRTKVNKYINSHSDMLPIYKLTHNKPLTKGDYQELNRVFTEELGTAEDYHREFGSTPFGLLVRKIGKLDHQAAMDAFSDFIDDQSLNARQIAFVKRVISYVEKNGYIDNPSDLLKPPFDKPQSFVRIFPLSSQKKLVQNIQQIKDNAIRIDA